MKLVLCHGTFDILHVGHFRHLREARSFGDRLVVSITAAEFVRKGPGHPAHTDAERIEQLVALRCVDEVYLCQDLGGVPAIRFYRPQVYVKGCDYFDRGIAAPERAACREVRAEVRFTRAEKRSVAELVSKFVTEVA